MVTPTTHVNTLRAILLAGGVAVVALTVALLGLGFASAADVVGPGTGKVVALTPESLKKTLAEHNVLVKYFAPYMKSDYEKLAKVAKNDDFVVAEFDGSSQQAPPEANVQGFPTIKFYKKGSTAGKGIDYENHRTTDLMYKFAKSHLKGGSEKKVQKEEKKEKDVFDQQTSVVELTDENFDKIVLNGNKSFVVKFYAPWCGHCKNMAADYDKAAKVFNGAPDNVVVAKLDATKHTGVARRFEIQGYPTLKIFHAGSADPVDYEGPRHAAGIVEYLNAQFGTYRKSATELHEKAGVVEELNDGALKKAIQIITEGGEGDLAEKAFSEVESALEEAKLEKRHKNSHPLYKRGLELLAKDGTGEALKKEIARVEKMKNNKDSLSQSDRENMQIKSNVYNHILENLEKPVDETREDL